LSFCPTVGELPDHVTDPDPSNTHDVILGSAIPHLFTGSFA
jgi:hypothetical protein